MEDNRRGLWMLITAIAPIAWGSSYFVTHYALPVDTPLWGAVLRALPAGVILLVISRRLPRGQWWWRSFVLGTLNVGGFFALVYVAGARLPSSVASTLMSTSALAMLIFAWVFLRQRPRALAVGGALVGLVGVVLMMGPGGQSVDVVGVVASLAAMIASSVGFVLTVRWGSDVPAVAMSSWQLLAGGIVILPLAVAVEGGPPAMTPMSALAFVYLALVATALAYAAWFAGLRHLPPGVVGIVGLLNPVTGVALGVLLAGEAFGVPQAIGMLLVVGGVTIGSWRAPRARGSAGSLRGSALRRAAGSSST